jgi:hypothetical protein
LENEVDNQNDDEIGPFGCGAIIIVLVIVSFALVNGLIPNYRIPFIFCLLIVGMLWMSFVWKQASFLFRLSAVFIMLHLIVFPYIYLHQLEKNPRSFAFDNFINSVEKEKSLAEIDIEFTPKDILFRMKIIDSLLNVLTPSSDIDSLVSSFYSKKIIRHGKYLLYTSYYIDGENNDTDSRRNEDIAIYDILVVCDTLGAFITDYPV